jgi:EpsI family protein
MGIPDKGSGPARWTAIATAVGLLLAFQGGYSLVAGQLARPGESVPLPAGTLGQLPQRIGDWVGYDVSLPQTLVAATATDDHLYRTYQRYAGTETIGLYIAYGIKGRDLMPHRPEVCYPDAGWTLSSRQRVRLPLVDATALDCTVYEFTQGGLVSRTIHVLNYFLVDGQYSPDVSLLRSRAWRGAGTLRYMAQVQVTCTGGALLSRETALRSTREFAAESARSIRGLLPGETAGNRAQVTGDSRPRRATSAIADAVAK